MRRDHTKKPIVNEIMYSLTYPNGEDGCWLHNNPNEQYFVYGKTMMVKEIVLQWVTGLTPVLDGVRCRLRPMCGSYHCVNPAHMRKQKRHAPSEYVNVDLMPENAF